MPAKTLDLLLFVVAGTIGIIGSRSEASDERSAELHGDRAEIEHGRCDHWQAGFTDQETRQRERAEPVVPRAWTEYPTVAKGRDRFRVRQAEWTLTTGGAASNSIASMSASSARLF